MRSIICPLPNLLAVSLLASGTLFACGGGDDQNNTSAVRDTEPARNPGGKVGSSCTDLGRDCNTCAAPPCFQPCTNNVLTTCRSLTDITNDAINEIIDSGIVDQINDTIDDAVGGLLDAGLTLPEGGFGIDLLGDASLPVCPKPLICQQGGSGVLGITAGLLGAVSGGRGAGVCADADKRPPTCMTDDDCVAAGFTDATCFDGSFAMLLDPNFPKKFCASLCMP